MLHVLTTIHSALIAARYRTTDTPPRHNGDRPPPSTPSCCSAWRPSRLMVAAWAAKSGKIGQLFDAVVGQLVSKAR